MAGILAPIYVDGARLWLGGAARPSVQDILERIGKDPTRHNVVHLRHRTDPFGRTLAPDEVIDRGSQTFSPVYLRILEVPWARGRPARPVAGSPSHRRPAAPMPPAAPVASAPPAAPVAPVPPVQRST